MFKENGTWLMNRAEDCLSSIGELAEEANNIESGPRVKS